MHEWISDNQQTPHLIVDATQPGVSVPPQYVKDGKIVLTGKLDGKEHVVPQIADAELSANGHTAMVNIPQHMEKLECYACHARWAPQCYGCHAKQDLSKPSGDWLSATS